MNKPNPCPICGAELQIHGPEDWKPSYSDPDSGGDPYNATCDCGFSFSTGTYDYEAFVAALNRRAPLPDNKALTPKITIVSRDIGDVSCRKCGHLFFRCFRPGMWNETQKRRKFCINCGQKLDWSDCCPPEKGE